MHIRKVNSTDHIVRLRMHRQLRHKNSNTWRLHAPTCRGSPSVWVYAEVWRESRPVPVRLRVEMEEKLWIKLVIFNVGDLTFFAGWEPAHQIRHHHNLVGKDKAAKLFEEWYNHSGCGLIKKIVRTFFNTKTFVSIYHSNPRKSIPPCRRLPPPCSCWHFPRQFLPF